MQIARYACLYARNINRKFAEVARTALEALRLQAPLFDLASLPTTLQHLKWRERGDLAAAQWEISGLGHELARTWAPIGGLARP